MPERSPASPHAIRAFEPRDALALAELFRRSVRTIGPRHYSAEQVEAWAANAPTAEELRARWADGRIVLVAVDAEDRPLAFGDLEFDGHIEFLYCAPEAAGQGIASELYDRLEALARGRGLARLHVEASEAGRSLFARKRFAVTAQRNLTVSRVPIHNYAMQKTL